MGDNLNETTSLMEKCLRITAQAETIQSLEHVKSGKETESLEELSLTKAAVHNETTKIEKAVDEAIKLNKVLQQKTNNMAVKDNNGHISQQDIGNLQDRYSKLKLRVDKFIELQRIYGDFKVESDL